MKKKATKKDPHHASDVDIAALAEGAARANNVEVMKLCSRAMLGNAKARKECARILLAARVMKSERAIRQTESFLSAHLPPKLLRKAE